jgi:hypothetical protein
MVSTRSKTAQTKLERLGVSGTKVEPKETKIKAKKNNTATSKKVAPKTPSSNTASKKRKSPNTPSSENPSKRVKTTRSPTKQAKIDDQEADPIIFINRAPVLQLWGACVAHFIYPSLSWETCLSAGSAISTICAISKGRSIGTVPEKNDSEGKQQARDKAKKKQKELDRIEVMHFKLKLKDGLVLVGSKQKPGSEELLKKKFAEKEYEAAKDAFDGALKSWEGDEEGLNEKAFKFYEGFRPDVRKGEKGWGRKGELSLAKVKSTIEFSLAAL